MKYGHIIVYALLIAAISYLLYASLNDAIEIDGLKQSVAQDHRSIDDLVQYIYVNSKCDVTPEQLSVRMGKGYDLLRPDKDSAEVLHLAFKAKFYEGKLTEVGIVDAAKTNPCKRS